ncbi:MAG: alpha/beta hydrolase [Pseudomonadota bacterium]|nr:alpha/beta hydrolase [Pseudomonadota bacterium]
MATAKVNGSRLHYELRGDRGIPLVLVHGSWDSHADWGEVVAPLAESYQVLTYDRRGHSGSERIPGQRSVREDVADLAALIEHLGLAPAWVVGNSFGASISVRLACEHPGLLRGLIAHEPPLFSLLADDARVAPMVQEVSRLFGAVVERIASGDHAGAAEQFVETVALGPARRSPVVGGASTRGGRHNPGRRACPAPDASRRLCRSASTFHGRPRLKGIDV